MLLKQRDLSRQRKIAEQIIVCVWTVMFCTCPTNLYERTILCRRHRTEPYNFRSK